MDMREIRESLGQMAAKLHGIENDIAKDEPKDESMASPFFDDGEVREIAKEAVRLAFEIVVKGYFREWLIAAAGERAESMGKRSSD